MKFIPRFFKEIRTVNPLLFYSNVFLRLLSAILPLLMLWVGKEIVDEVVLQIDASDKDFYRLGGLIGLELLLALLSDFFSRGISLSDSLLGDQYSIRSSVQIIRKTSEINLDQLEDSEFYDKLERARRQTTGRVGLMSNVLSQAQDTVVIISLLIGVISFQPWLIILLLISIIPTIWNEIKFSGTSYSLVRGWTQERRELDYLRYAGASDLTAKEVKLFGLADYIAERFKSLSDQYYLASKSLAQKRALWGGFFNLLGTTAYYAAYASIVYQTVGAVFSLGDMTFLAGSFNRSRNQLQGFFGRFTAITERALYLQDYFEFLDLQFEEQPNQKNLPLPATIKEGFRFEKVGFKYPNSEQWVVRDISFTLKAGEKLAFVGENGAGKTTLIKLLLQFYKTTEGTIYLDNIPISDFNREAYQQYFGVIFQDFVKFELSLRENIAVGKIDAIKQTERLDAAAYKSLATEVVESLPLGYDQQLGRRFKNGKDLSGGQWQKIAIARAYMKDAEVLVLDEPTSALDARAETEAFDRFIKLTQGKTAVIISHRFSTVRIADRILVLKNGQVHEIGSHEELLADPKLYAELFLLQAEGYK